MAGGVFPVINGILHRVWLLTAPDRSSRLSSCFFVFWCI